MLKVLKSYLRTYLKQWIETIGLVLFVTIISMAIIGMLVSPLQLMRKNNQIKAQSNEWNYSLISKPTQFENNFTYEYFVDDSTEYGISPIIDKGSDPNNYGILSQTGYDTLLSKDGDPRTNSDAQLAWGQDLKLLLNTYFNYTENPTSFTDTGGQPILASEFFNPTFKDKLKNYYNDVSYYVNSKVMLKHQDKFAFSYDLTFYYEVFKNSTNVVPDYYLYITNGTENINPITKTWIDNLIITQGVNDLKNNKIVITDKFAKDNNYQIGSSLDFWILGTIIPELNQPTISGFGTKIDTLSQASDFPMTGDAKKYAAVFVNENILQELYSKAWQQPNKTNSFKFHIDQRVTFINGSDYQTLKNMFSATNDQDKTIYDMGTTVLTSFGNLKPVSSINSMNMMVTIYTILGVVMIILAFVFISFVMKKEINKTRKQLGIFKALGYQTSELSWIFTVKTLITILLGVICGYLISIPLQIYMYGQFEKIVTFAYNQVYYAAGFMIILFIVIPSFFTVASYISTFLYIKEPVLSLVNNGAKATKKVRTGLVYRSLAKRGKVFTWRLQLAFTARNKGKFVLVIILFFYSSFILILMLGAVGVGKSIVSGMFNNLNPNLDHQETFRNFPKTNSNDKGKLTVTDNFYQKLDFKYQTYQNVEDINFNNNSADLFHQDVIKIDPTAPDAKDQYFDLFNKYQVVNGSVNQHLYLRDLQTIFLATQNSSSVKAGVVDPSQYSAFSSLMLNSLMMGANANTIVTFNELWYNPTNETTVYGLSVVPNGNLDENNMQIIGLSNDQKIGGLYTSAFSWKGINNEQITKIFADYNSIDNTIPGIISIKLAKDGKYKIGDTIKVKSATPNKIGVNVKVEGIIKNDIIGANIYTGYHNLINNLFVPNTIDPNDPSKNIYTGLYSQQQLYEGKIDLNNMENSISKLKFIGNNLSIDASPGQTLLEALTNLQTQAVSATLVSATSNFSMLPLNILKSSIDDMLDKQNNLMILFEVLTALIVLILLTVVVIVIIDEVMPIILTMKAIGYKNSQINFAIMGSYVIAIVIIFIVSWLASMLAWQGIGLLLYSLFKIVIDIPIDYQGPLIALAVITVILGTSWLVAMNTIKRRKVTQITE